MNDENRLKMKKSISRFLIFIIIAIVLVIVCAKYLTDEAFRENIDTKIFKKKVEEATLSNIEIDSETNPYVFAYDKYIAILSKNKLSQYTTTGKKGTDLDVDIAVPLASTNGNYLAIAEKNGNKIYVISGDNIVWKTQIEGNVSNININENGYVSIVIKNTTYKSVVAFYDPKGTELFRRYVSTSYVVCTDISPNNKFLAIGEVDYLGTVIKSSVKIISVENAQKDPNNDIVYTYESENGAIITNINYQDKNYAICMFNEYIEKVTENSNERIYDITNNDLFVDINMKDSIVTVDKQSSGLFSYEYEMRIKNTDSKAENLYILNSDLPKTIIINGDKIAMNLGNEARIVSSGGWLLKRYTSSKQIKNIVIGENIAGIIYKNKIEIINI